MADLSGKFITYRGSVSMAECDHMGHMNVRYYCAKFDEATWVMFTDIGLTSTYFRTQDRGMAALEMNIKFKRELLAGEVVNITSKVLKVTDKVITYSHEMCNAETGEIAATCHEVAVHLDTAARKSLVFSDELRARLESAL